MWVYLKGFKKNSLDPRRFHPESEGLDHSQNGGVHLADWGWLDTCVELPQGVEFPQGHTTIADPDFKAALWDAVREGVLETHFLP